MKAQLLLLVLILFTVPNLKASEKVLDCGFEGWGGTIGTSSDYPFTNASEAEMDTHEACSEVVTSYDGVSPNTGTYFFLIRNSPNNVLDPGVDGITEGCVNDYIAMGWNKEYGGQNTWGIDTITSGEIYIEFWAVLENYDNTTQGSSGCKWIRINTDNSGYGSRVILYLKWRASYGDDFKIDFLIGPSYEGSTTFGLEIDDNDWHKWAMYVDFNTDRVYFWFDVETPTLSNYTRFVQSTDANVGAAPAQYVSIQGNFSAQTPDEEVWHTLDDIKIWDGMPDAEEEEATTINLLLFDD